MEDIEDTIIDNSSPTVIDVIDLTKESPRTRPSQSRQRHTEDVSVNQSTTGGSNYYCICTYKRRLPSIVSKDAQNTQMEDHSKETKMHRDITSADEVMTIDDSMEESDERYRFKPDTRASVSLTCPICFESLSSNLKPTTTRCGHIFCAECLETFLRSSKKCPTCKSNVTLKSCTRLYL